jgi:outer membrane protein OmpA-like peptidoglycan-associated protein
LLVFFLLPASSAPSGPLLEVGLKEKVPWGQKPILKIHVLADLNSLELTLDRADGRTVHHGWTALTKGAHLEFKLPQTQGRFRYQGSLRAKAQDQSTGEMPLDFEARVQARPTSMGLTVRYKDLDLKQHRLLMRSKRPMTKVDYVVTAEDGTRLAKGSYQPEKPARRIQLSWQPAQAKKVLKIDLQAHATDGRWEKIQLIPWSWKIPHEELRFATGQWAISEEEAKKLDTSYQLLQEGQARYRNLIQAKLYIGGFTDTVGSARANQKLSENRARAIAEYFCHKGFKGPIFYQGFGEKVQNRKTADNVPEAQNRRAVYALAGTAPALGVPENTEWIALFK